MSGDKLKRDITKYASIGLALAMLGCGGKKATIPEVKDEKIVTIGVNGGNIELDGMKLDFRKSCFSEDTEVRVRKANPNINAEYQEAKSLEIRLENAARDSVFVSSNYDFGIGIYERDGTKHVAQSINSRFGIPPRNQVNGEDITTASIIDGKKNEYRLIFDRYDGNSRKPIVVFIHGLNSNSRAFDFLRERIPDDYDIVSVEYDSEESTEISVGKIKEFLATLPTDKEIYEIDHSKGCEVGLDLAINDKRIKKIIQLAPPNRGFITKDESLNKSLETIVNIEMLENFLNIGSFGVVIPTKLVNQGTKDMVVNSIYMRHLNQAHDLSNVDLLIIGGEYNSGNLDLILERPHDGLLPWVTSNFNLFPSNVLYPRFSRISTILQDSSHGSIVREQQTLDRILEFLKQDNKPISFQNKYITDVAINKDGQRICFSMTETAINRGNPDLYLINADGTGLRRITNTSNLEEDNPIFSSDGNSIYYLETEFNGYYFLSRIKKVNLLDGSLSDVTDKRVRWFDGGNVRHFDIKDGKRFFAVGGNMARDIFSFEGNFANLKYHYSSDIEKGLGFIKTENDKEFVFYGIVNYDGTNKRGIYRYNIDNSKLDLLKEMSGYLEDVYDGDLMYSVKAESSSDYTTYIRENGIERILAQGRLARFFSNGGKVIYVNNKHDTINFLDLNQ